MEAMLEVEPLKDEIRRQAERARLAEGRAAAFERIADRARRVVKYAQVDGGRHALESALNEYDGSQLWPAFLAGRLGTLKRRAADERAVLSRGE